MFWVQAFFMILCRIIIICVMALCKKGFCYCSFRLLNYDFFVVENLFIRIVYIDYIDIALD